MDLKTIDKAIGTGIVILIGYHIIGVFIPMLTWGVVALVILRVYLTYHNYK